MGTQMATAMVAILSGSILLAVVFSYLSITEHERGLLLWSIAWTVYSLRFVVDLVQANLAPASMLLTVLSQLLVLATALLLLEGTGEMAGSHVPRWPLYLGALAAAWVIFAGFVRLPILYLSGPVFALRGAASILTGAMWWRNSTTTGRWGRVTGTAFIGWGIHNLDYPFLITVAWFAPTGFLIGAIFEFVIAIGALLSYFDRTRSKLAESERSYRALADNARDVIVRYTHAPEAGLDFVSAGVIGLIGYEAAEVKQHPELLLGDPASEGSIYTALAEGYDFTQRAVFRIAHRDGEFRYAEVQGGLAAIGTPQGGAATELIIRDVTDRVRADEAIQESIERYMALFQQSPSIMLLIDPRDATILGINAAGERYYGWTSAELRGGSLKRIDRFDPTEVIAEAVQKGVGAESYCIRSQMHADGSETPVEVYLAFIRISGTDVLYAIVHDITKRIEAERALEASRANLEKQVQQRTSELMSTNSKLEAATSAKDDFLTSMSHELRTPLNSVIGFSRILLQELPGPINDEQRHQIGMIEYAGRHLLTIVNQLLDLSSVEAGREIPTTTDVDVSQLASRMAGAVEPLVSEQGIALKLDIASGLHLRTDGRFLEQILWNLLGNAIKYTAKGTVSLTVRSDGDECVFEVDDTGCGMNTEQLVHAFDRFTRFRTPSALQGGTGLGLTISRRLAEQLGGTLTATSVPGQGSHFVLRLMR